MSGTKIPDGSAKVLELFEEGKKLTEDLLKENERLRYKIASMSNEASAGRLQELETENRKLSMRVRILESELEAVNEQLEAQRKQFELIEDESREFGERYVKVERQNSDLISMYVASYRLHSTLRFDEVVEIIKEVVINMIGAEIFGVFIVDHDADVLEMIAHEGLDEIGEPRIAMGQGAVGLTAETGELHLERRPGSAKLSFDKPLACFPLQVEDEIMGVIAIYKLLVQKDGFQQIDYELFTLLSGHAATALYGAKMFTISERKRSTLEGFVNLMKAKQK